MSLPGAEKVLLIVHQRHSVPGRIGALLAERGYMLDQRCPCIGHDLPEHLDDHAGVVVFGGPMSANDDHLDGIRAELAFMETILASGKPLLGICLGGQLLARSLGARVYLHERGEVEIGYTRIQPTEAGRDRFAHSEFFYQWHKEGFEVPAGGTLLAAGERFPNQAYSYGGNALGLQFHPEITFEMIQRWTTSAAHRLELPGAQPKPAHLKGYELFDERIDRWARATLDWLGLAGPAARLAAAAE